MIIFEEGDFIFFQSKYRFKYIFRSIIQIFTGKDIVINNKKYKFEHAARYSKGNIYECTFKAFWNKKLKGCIKTLVDERLSYKKNYTKIYIIRPNPAYSKTVADFINEALESKIGSKYKTSEAILAYLENFLPSNLKIKFFKKAKLKDFFCSKYAAFPDYLTGRINDLPRTLTPNELAVILLKNGAKLIEL